MKTAFVLTGEGARGAIQAKAMLDLHKKGIRPDKLFGISSGAINAVAGSIYGPKGLWHMWEDIDQFSAYAKFNWKFLWSTGIFKLGRLGTAIDSLPEWNDSYPEFEYYITSLKSGNLMPVRQDKHTNGSLRAAITIPGFLPPQWGNYVDGGLRQMAPILPAIEQGYELIYVIAGRAIHWPEKYTPEKGLLTFLGLDFLKWARNGYRIVDLALFTTFRNDLTKAEKKNRQEGYKHVEIKYVLPNPRESYDTLDFHRVPEGLNWDIEIPGE